MRADGGDLVTKSHLFALDGALYGTEHVSEECGWEADQTAHVVSVRCGTLESDPVVRPAAHSFVGSKAPWFEICDALPQAPGSFA